VSRFDWSRIGWWQWLEIGVVIGLAVVAWLPWSRVKLQLVIAGLAFVLFSLGRRWERRHR
jgi:hypothetical protein